MTRLSNGLVFVLISIGASSFADAEPTGGNGIKMGEGRVHPFFDLELRYSSAAGYFPPSSPGQAGTFFPELTARFRPGLRLEIPSDSIAVNVIGDLDYIRYLGILTPGSTSASRLEGLADLNVQIHPKGTLEVDLGDHFNRSDRTNNAAIGIGILSLYNEVHAAVPLRTRGETLELTPKAAFGVEFFQPLSTFVQSGCVGDPACDLSIVQQMNYSDLKLGVEGRFKFLPKTALVAETGYELRHYFTPGLNLPAYLIKSSVGLLGLVTSKLTVIGKVGWSEDLGPTQAKLITAHLEGAYALSLTSQFKLGYLRSLDPVPAYGTLSDDRLYAEGRWISGGKLNVRGTFAYDALVFAGAGRHDQMIWLDLGPEYELATWFSASGGYLLSFRTSTQNNFTANFVRHEIYGKVTFTY